MLFISHRSTDKQFALDIMCRAQVRGYSAQQLFLDSDRDAGIAAGADWEQEIYNRLKDCRALIVVCSPRLAESKWCFAELVVAKTLGKLVFPVVVEDCPLDAFVGQRQAVFAFKEGDAAYDRLWKSLEQHGLGPYDTQPWPPLDEVGKTTDPCPYPGLMAFSERFAPVFFGRDPEIAAVLDKLNGMRHRGEPRMLLIHGGSGSGKSSLLKAGVLPRLARNRDWVVLPTLRYGETPSDDETLFAKLAKELTVRFPPESATRPDWNDLRTKFESDDVEAATQCFIDVTQDLTMALDCHDATTLLPLDQFEELLTSSVRPSTDKFLKFLRVLLSRNNGKLLAIATLRSDYLDVYERNPHALQPPYLLTDRLPPFPWERVTDVIVQPAARVGVTFTNDLLERLKLDAPTSDALPLLAFTLEKLFRECARDKKIELGEYESLGGMTGAIEQAVNKIVPPNLLAETEQALRLSFVRHLVQVNERDEFVRRPARWSELPAPARPLLEKFVNERLLHTSGEGSATTVEVSHEALFRCWDQLKAWLHAELNNLRLRRKLEVTAKEWNGSATTETPDGDQDLCFTLGQLEAVDDWKQHVILRDIEERFLKASRNKRYNDTQREIERLQQLADAERKKQQAESQRASDAIRFSKRLKWAVVGTTAFALVAFSLGDIAWKQSSVAVEKTRIAVEQTGIAETETLKAITEGERAKRSADEALAVLIFFNEKVLAAARPKNQEGGLGVDATVRAAIDSAEPQIGPAFHDKPLVEASIRETLGLTYSYLGEPKLAIRQHERSRKMRLDQLGTDDLKTLSSMNNLANAYQDAGMLDEAISLYQQTLEKYKAILGADDTHTLGSMSNLAAAYLAAGNLDEGLPLYEKTLEKYANLGPDRHDTLGCMNNLATAYYLAGKLDKALPLYKRTLEKQKANLVADHPDILQTMNNLAIAYQEAGQLHEALPLLEESLEKRKEKLKPDHPDTLQTMYNLVRAYKADGRIKEAETLLLDAFESARDRFGLADRRTQTYVRDLADCYAEMKQPEKAEPIWRGLMAFWKQKEGADSPEYAEELANLGMNLLQQQKPVDAEPFLRECLLLFEKNQPDDVNTFNTMSLLGLSLLKQKKFADAEPLLVSGHKGMEEREEKIPAKGQFLLTEALERLIQLYETWGKPEQAAKWKAKFADARRLENER